MRLTLRILSWCGLALTITAPILYFLQSAEPGTSHLLMTLGMVCWFAGDLPRAIRESTSP